MEGTNYYFDATNNKFKKCYTDYNTYFAGGNSNDMKCNICGTTKPYFAETNNYFSNEYNFYKKCY